MSSTLFTKAQQTSIHTVENFWDFLQYVAWFWLGVVTLYLVFRLAAIAWHKTKHEYEMKEHERKYNHNNEEH